MKLAGFFCVLAAAMVVLGAAAGERPDLIGRTTEPDGTPIKDASVFIYTAGPRVGPGFI